MYTARTNTSASREQSKSLRGSQWPSKSYKFIPLVPLHYIREYIHSFLALPSFSPCTSSEVQSWTLYLNFSVWFFLPFLWQGHSKLHLKTDFRKSSEGTECPLITSYISNTPPAERYEASAFSQPLQVHVAVGRRHHALLRLQSTLNSLIKIPKPSVLYLDWEPLLEHETSFYRSHLLDRWLLQWPVPPCLCSSSYHLPFLSFSTAFDGFVLFEWYFAGICKISVCLT